MPHRPRPERDRRVPLHMTTRVCSGLPSLRSGRAHRTLLDALRAGADRFGFRLVEFSVQRDHFHLLIEVEDQLALTRGAKGLGVRLARALNKLWGRKGQVFADRYHVRALKSPLEVRRALAYVLHNARKHGDWGRGIDPFSSGPWFEGFERRAASQGAAASTASAHAGAQSSSHARPQLLAERLARWPRPPCRPRTWLLVVGWRRHGPIGVEERPGGAQRGASID
ncbi:MAG: hypothetical protein EPO68_17845 [Planctomycetota bacterium]|nr:MAG: hypothetical protein EPO68_17845 [Planctomycetota bacterium]